ncbi:MAG TPA: hypothetical protein VK691_08405 [Solirubrobacteraceae bacterium]|nr:hypothetical protein [Solirubrobacteraceae bacterium]
MSAHAAPGSGHGEHAPTGSSTATHELHTGWLGDPRRRATADGLLLVLAAATVAVCLLQSHGTARLLLVLAAACLIPGGALLTRLPVEDGLEAFGLAVGFGFTIEAFGALLMVWTGWWHPFGWAIVLGLVACTVLVADLRRNVAIVRKPVQSPASAAGR